MTQVSTRLSQTQAKALLDQFDQEVLGYQAQSRQSLAEWLSGSQESLGDWQDLASVKGRVVAVLKDMVVVDFNYKVEGYIPIDEFKTDDGYQFPRVGDELLVTVERWETDRGLPLLSHKRAQVSQAWDQVLQAYQSGQILDGLVTSKVKGGLIVDIGVPAFLPASQVDVKPVRSLDVFVGQKIPVRVIKINRRRSNVVVSRRIVLEENLEQQKRWIEQNLKEGARVKGIVKNITDFGAFVDVGGLSGLVHISDLSWGRIKHPSQVLQVGQEAEFVVLKYDPEKNRLNLGLKQLQPDPWESTAAVVAPGARLKGTVVALIEAGVFVELFEGVEGFVHVSELSWNKIKHPSEVVQVGDVLDVLVLSVDRVNRRINLSVKQLQESPWEILKQTLLPGTIIEGEVKAITDFGIFVQVQPGIDGLVRLSDISWKRVSNPQQMFQKGQKVRAVVLNVDAENQKISLGIKQLEPDPWLMIEQKYAVGTQHQGEVVKVFDFGAVVRLDPEVEGFLHVSEISLERVAKAQQKLKVGDKIRVEVIQVDRENRRISLSAKAVALREGQVNWEDFQKQAVSSRTTLGDVLSQSLKKED